MSRLRLSLIALLFALCTPSGAQQLKLSPDEQAVWKLEHSYWQYVQTFDLDAYRNLWHSDFLGWPFVSPSPVHKEHITDWITDFRSKGLHLESFDLHPAASRVNGSTVVVFYSITARLVDKNGKGDPATTRITHTWIKVGNNWRIISGMSAAVDVAAK